MGYKGVSDFGSMFRIMGFAGTNAITVTAGLLYTGRYSWKPFHFLWPNSPPQWARASSLTRFLDHTQRRTTFGKDSSARVISSSQRPLPDNTHNRHPCPRCDSNPNPCKWAAADPRRRPRGHCDRQLLRRTLKNTGQDVFNLEIFNLQDVIKLWKRA